MKAIFEHPPRPSGASFIYRLLQDGEGGFAWHYHTEYELTLVVCGSGWRFVGDSVERYGAPDLVLVGSEVPHAWHADSSMDERIVIHFRRELAGSTFDAPELQPLSALLERSGRGLQFNGAIRDPVMRRALDMQHQDGFERLLSLLWILHVLSGTPHARVLAGPSLSAPTGESQGRIKTVMKYLNEHYREPLRASHVARIACMEITSFSRFFRRTTGRSFMDYVRELRITYACDLLARTDLPITEICFESGFGNVASFNRAFRRVKSETPRDYRGRWRSATSGRPCSPNLVCDAATDVRSPRPETI